MPGPRVTVDDRWIPEGNLGNSITIARMLELIRGARAGPRLGRLIERTRRVSEVDRPLAVWSLLHPAWVREPDPYRIERVKTPEYLLMEWEGTGVMRGDCDDAVTLFGAILYGSGMRVSVVALGVEDEEWSHVYLKAYLGDGYYPLDVVEPHAFGWEAPEAVSRVEFFA